jgi:hypothetical protein
MVRLSLIAILDDNLLRIAAEEVCLHVESNLFRNDLGGVLFRLSGVFIDLRDFVHLGLLVTYSDVLLDFTLDQPTERTLTLRDIRLQPCDLGLEF